jgi:hypothetical protein
MSFSLVYLSQQDPQWKNDLLGFGDPGDTIGYVGCALTSVAMLASGHGYAETPKTLNEKMKAANGFVSSGIRWEVISKVHPQITLKENISCETTNAPLAKIDAALAAGQPVVVRVDSSPAPGLQWHYVMVYARKGNDYLMLDPYPYQPGTAKEDLLMARYSRGNPLERSIQQVLIYQCSTSGGTISTPASSSSTPSSQPTPSGQPQPTPASFPPGPRARVKAEVTWGLNVRSSTDTSSLANLVANVPAGSELLLTEANAESKIGMDGQWVKVRTANGKEGFAAAWFLDKVTAATPAPSTAPAPSPSNEAPVPVPAPTTPVSPPPAPTPATPASPPSTPQPPVAEKLKVKVASSVGKAGLRMRESPSADGKLMVILKADTKLTVVEPADKAKTKVGKAGKWLYVREPNGQRGYVTAEWIQLA